MDVPCRTQERGEACEYGQDHKHLRRLLYVWNKAKGTGRKAVEDAVAGTGQNPSR